MEFVNSEFVKDLKIEELKKSFSHGKPYKYVFIENFLNEEKANKILEALNKEEFCEKECDLFSLNQTNDFSSIKKGILKDFYESFKCEELGNWVEKISGIKLEIGKIDMSGSLYKEGSYLLCHDDELEGRKIAYVFYLSRDFEKKDGGSFVMLNSLNGEPTDEAKRYSPKWNSILMFEVSEKSFHEVEENMSKKDRYAIGGWFH